MINMRARLAIHPDFTCPAVAGVEVGVYRTGPTMIEIGYRVSGEIGRLSLPQPSAPLRADELWRHTCFELFARPEAGGYLEFNFAPSGQWAAYRFSGYREGMAQLNVAAPRIRTSRRESAFELTVELDLADTDLVPDAGPPIALTAVIETVDGERSYWSLAHAPGKPDFHHAASFAAELPRQISIRES